MSEIVKAPEIEGFEQCSHEDWLNSHTPGHRLYLRIENDTFYYERIKPKEKSMKEVFIEILKRYGWGDHTTVTSTFEDMADYIEANYVKKEGEMNKAQKSARFKAMGGREGIAKRILEIAQEIVENGSYKRATAGAGQLRLLAELCDSEAYWQEIMYRGYGIESRISNGAKKCKLTSDGHVDFNSFDEDDEACNEKRN